MMGDHELINYFNDYIKQSLTQLVDHYFTQELKVKPAYVTKKQVAQIAGLSTSLLDTKFFPRPEVLAIEHDYGTKRRWAYPEVRELVKEFLDEKKDYVPEKEKTLEVSVKERFSA